MAIVKFIILLVIIELNTLWILGHGMMLDPVNRASAWRLGFNTPIDYNDNEFFCGGANIHHNVNGGNCGVCGDDYRDEVPRSNENGGYYGTGIIVKNYTEGQEFIATVRLTANHNGHFEFSLCPLDDEHDTEDEECFDKNKIETIDGGFMWKLPTNESRDFEVKLILPTGLTCKHCSLRWHYRSANSWGICSNQTGAVGCGPQEVFRSCSDVAILPV